MAETGTARPLGRDTPEAEIAAFVDAAGRDALAELLPERHPVYAGRSANAAARIRGYVLAAFERVGLPEAALPYALEELESGRDAYTVAAAAKALRGLADPTDQLAALLHRAAHNVRHVDDAVTFQTIRPSWPAAGQTTARSEIDATLAWLGARAPATRRGGGPVPIHLDVGSPGRGGEPPSALELEDQEGRRLTYGQFFGQVPSVAVFFYTRCDNPNKCSSTITKLGRLQRRIREEGLAGRLRTAAITYDPGYDLPARLRAYGQIRGVEFGESDRFFRAPAGLAALEQYFELGVSFGQPLVNRHRIELYLLDAGGRVAATLARRQWEVEDVLERARGLAVETERG